MLEEIVDLVEATLIEIAVPETTDANRPLQNYAGCRWDHHEAPHILFKAFKKDG